MQIRKHFWGFYRIYYSFSLMQIYTEEQIYCRLSYILNWIIYILSLLFHIAIKKIFKRFFVFLFKYKGRCQCQSLFYVFRFFKDQTLLQQIICNSRMGSNSVRDKQLFPWARNLTLIAQYWLVQACSFLQNRTKLISVLINTKVDITLLFLTSLKEFINIFNNLCVIDRQKTRIILLVLFF